MDELDAKLFSAREYDNPKDLLHHVLMSKWFDDSRLQVDDFRTNRMDNSDPTRKGNRTLQVLSVKPKAMAGLSFAEQSLTVYWWGDSVWAVDPMGAYRALRDDFRGTESEMVDRNWLSRDAYESHLAANSWWGARVSQFPNDRALLDDSHRLLRVVVGPDSDILRVLRAPTGTSFRQSEVVTDRVLGRDVPDAVRMAAYAGTWTEEAIDALRILHGDAEPSSMSPYFAVLSPNWKRKREVVYAVQSSSKDFGAIAF